MNQFDALIFDMDGTLWDAVDSYCRVWDITFAQVGFPQLTVGRDELISCMGMPIGEIYRRLIDIPLPRRRFLRALDRNEELLMPVLGGKLYPGVAELMPQLAERYSLFMVSNCGALGLVNFLTFTGLGPYITDILSYGQTGLEKDGNIRLLRQRYNLRNPIYIGDTAGDCRHAHAAGIPMMHAAYGFGKAPDAEYSAPTFADVARFFLDNGK